MTEKQILPLPIGPGVYTEQTERGAIGRWYRSDKVRFRKGLAEKIGGWIQLAPQFAGICRRIHDWVSLDNKKWSAMATDQKLYLWQDGVTFDITPLRDSGTLTNPFSTTIGLSVVNVLHANHGGQVGDYVRFTGATAGGGLTVTGEYRINTVVDTSNYTIVDNEVASSTAAGTGGTVSYEYDIHIGASTAQVSTGYGTGPYGEEGYGNARTGSTLVLRIRTWALDNWGEDLLANPQGGAIYWWDRSKGTGSRATALGGDAPSINEYMIISQRDRHIIALGAYDYFNNKIDPLLIRWSSTEDLEDWVPTATNTSGDLRLYRGSRIVTAVRSRLETVVFTDVSVHSLPFFGGFDVFGLNVLGENVSILGPNCAVPVDHRVMFMAEADFYVYDGIVRVLNCDVRNYVYENLNVTQKDKIYGGLNREFNEVWWFYPSYDPDAWIQQDFSLGLPPGYRLELVTGGATLGYSYIFESGGSTTVVGTAQNGYEYDYVLHPPDPLLTPLEAEYAVELDIDPAHDTAQNVGLAFLKQDIVSAINTSADDEKGFFVELDMTNNAIRVRKKTPAGTFAVPTNAGTGNANFTTVTGSAMALATKYIIIAKVDTPQITISVDGFQAFQFNMSAQELLDHTGGTAGFHVRANTNVTDEVRFYNFAAGPLGVLTAATFDISPIEVNRYVAFNYEEDSWTAGMLARTAWHDRSPILEKPYATSPDGYIYQHETGVDDNGSAMSSYIESFDMEIGAGEQLLHVDQLIPDFLTLEGSVNVYLKGRKYPQDPNLITKGPYTVASGVRKISTRIRARQVRIRVESITLGDKWRMGHWRGRAGAHGKRG